MGNLFQVSFLEFSSPTKQVGPVLLSFDFKLLLPANGVCGWSRQLLVPVNDKHSVVTATLMA